jgi:hypothetical protein
MALQPEDRPAGSQHVLRFNGTVTVGGTLATFPKDNGELTTGGAVGDPRGVRFLFADATDLANQERRFPSLVYDDGQPAGAAPHDPIATTLTALVVNADESDIGLRTWAQNMRVYVKALSANVVSVSTEDCFVVTDTLTSGLGTDTGLPVLIIPVVLSGEEVDSIELDVLVLVPWTGAR